MAAEQTMLDAYRAGTGSRLRLGIIPFVSGPLIESLIAELTGERHRMSITVTEASTTALLEELRLENLDAVIGRCSTDHGRRGSCRRRWSRPSDVGHDIERLGGVRRLRFPVPLDMPPVGLMFALRHRDTPVVQPAQHIAGDRTQASRRLTLEDCPWPDMPFK